MVELTVIWIVSGIAVILAYWTYGVLSQDLDQDEDLEPDDFDEIESMPELYGMIDIRKKAIVYAGRTAHELQPDPDQDEMVREHGIAKETDLLPVSDITDEDTEPTVAPTQESHGWTPLKPNDPDRWW